MKDGAIDVQPGDLDDWERRRAAGVQPQAERKSAGENQGLQARRERALERERREKVLGPTKKAIAELEQRIAELEKIKKDAEAQLADAALFADPVRSTPVVKAYQDATRKLDELYAAGSTSRRSCQRWSPTSRDIEGQILRVAARPRIAFER